MTMCFVSWSAATAARAIAASASHCAGPAARERFAVETGLSASVDEPTRTSTGRTGSLTRAPSSAGSRCRATPTDTPRAARRDLAAAVRARPVRAVLDPLQRGVDLGEHLCRVLLERVVDLAIERRRRRLGELVVVRAGDLLHLVVEAAGMLLAEVRDRVVHALALLEQDGAEVLGVDGHERLSFAAAAVRRRSTSAGPIPVSSTIFSRPPCPETSVRASRGTRACRRAAGAPPRSRARARARR